MTAGREIWEVGRCLGQKKRSELEVAMEGKREHVNEVQDVVWLRLGNAESCF